MKQLYPRILCIAIFLAGYFHSLAVSQSKLDDIFIENRGQVKTEKGTLADNVLFYKGGPLQLYITSTGFSAIVRNTGKSATTYNKIDFKFDKATISKEQVIFVGAQNAPINIYGPGTNVLTGVKSGKTIVIKNIYPGIDWLWTIDNKGAVNHDFMVNAGADASVIHYTVNGADIDKSGGDILKYVNKNFRLREGPVVYKTRQKDLAGQINVKGNDISYQLSDELKKGGFTIDPPLQLDWSLPFDIPTLTSFSAITTDDSLNTYSVGYSSDYHLPTFPEVYGSYVMDNPDGGSQDAVIMKTDPNQNLVWATFFGGSGNDQANAIAATPTGIFVVGYSESWDFPQATLGTYNRPVSLTSRDAFIVKLNSVGLLYWSTGYGGSKVDEALDVKYYNGLIYVGGYTYSRNFPTFTDSINTNAYFYHDSTITRSDAFLLEFDTAANRIWSTCFGGSGDDFFSSIWVDGSGIYATGYSDSITGASIPLVSNGPAYYQTTFQKTESFVVHFADTGVLDWSTYYGGKGNDISSCIVRNACRLMICGKTNGDSIPVMDQGNGNYYQSNYVGGGSDGFIAAFDPNTYQQVYGTYYGSAGYDALTKFVTDANCNTIFTGFSNGQLPVTGDPLIFYLQNNINGAGFDGIMLGLNKKQNSFWSTYFGSSTDDFGLDVAIIEMPIVDMVGTSFYNYGNDTIGGTFLTNDTVLLPCPEVTSNGVSNRFNTLGWGGHAHGGGGGGGNGNCAGQLQFQSLIPIKNACPNQCNGVAKVDIDNVGGCPPIKVLWSNGDTTLIDTSLCTLYWNKITDSLGYSRELYGKFDVLRVPSVPMVTTFCGIQPDWNTIILPQGGGAPYTIDYRGVSLDSCPATAYFNISDTAGCTVSFSLPWNAVNVGITSVLSIDTSHCAMIVNSTFGGACPSFDGSNKWFYVLTRPNGDTINFPFSNYGQQVVVPLHLDSITGGNYSIYLNMEQCNSDTGHIFWYPVPRIGLQLNFNCHGYTQGIFTAFVDPAVFLSLGGYSETIVITDVSWGGATQYFTKIIHFTASSDQTWTLDSIWPLSEVHIKSVIIQNQTDEGRCGTLIADSSADGVGALLFNDPSLCTGRGLISIGLIYGPWQAYSYYWTNNGSTDSTLYVTQPGVYTVIVTDSNFPGCPLTLTDTIRFLHDSVAINALPCGPGLLGAGIAYPTGGLPPYHYRWSSGEISSNAYALPQGPGWIIVNAGNGCTDTLTFVNNKKLPLSVLDTIHNPLCYYSSDGSIALTVSGGYTPYQIQWHNGAATGFNPTGLQGGNYVYVITDSLNCPDSSTVTLVKPDSIIFQVVNVTRAGCSAANGSAQVNATGGTGQLNILWSDEGAGFLRNDLAAGTYDFTITDANNCQGSGSVHIDSVHTLNAAVSKTNVLCYGTSSGSASVTIYQGNQPINYNWNYPSGPGPDSQVVANLATGAYSVTITDNSGCSITSTFSISQPDTLTTVAYNINPSSCSGNSGYAQLYIQGGTPNYGVHWSNQETGAYAYGLAPGYYSYVVTDGHQCVDTGSIYIADTNGLQPVVTPINSCTGANSGAAYATVTDVYSNSISYIWSYYGNVINQSNAVINNLAPGDYSVTISDDQGCDTVISFLIFTAGTDLAVAVDTGAGIQCYFDYGTVNVSATGSFGPFNGTGSFQQYPGQQLYIVTDQTGCGIVDTITLTAPTPVYSTITTTSAGCSHGNGSIQITTTGGIPPYTVYYTNQSQTYHYADTIQLPPGSYFLEVYDSLGCINGYQATIGTLNTIRAHVTTANVLCYGDASGSAQAIVTSGTQPITYSWSNGNITDNNIQNLTPGTYSVTITTATGCTYDSTFLITQPATPITITVDTGNGIFCNGGAAFVNVYASGGNGDFSGTGGYQFYAGTNTVTVQDAQGCPASQDVTLWQPLPLNAGYSVTPPGCAANSSATIELTTNGGVQPYSTSFQGNGYNYNDSVSIVNVSIGFYTLNIYDANNCNTSVSINVQPDSGIVAQATSANPVCYASHDGSITISIVSGTTTGPFTVNGNQFASTYTFDSLGQGFYTYTVTNLGGCSSTVQAAVFAPLPMSATSSIVQQVPCYGGQAQVSVAATGGVPPYNGTGQFSYPYGTYQDTVTDASGCPVIVSFSVSQPDTLIADSGSASPTVCSNESNNGSIYINVTGGTYPFSYSLNTGQHGFGTDVYNLAAGHYTFTVTDNNQCQDTGSFTINSANGFTAFVDTFNACTGNNGSAKIDFTTPQNIGFYGIQWFDQFNNFVSSADSIGNLSPGQYNVVVSNGACDTTIYFNIVQNFISFTVSIDSGSGIKCHGGSVNGSLNVTGGYPPYNGINQFNQYTFYPGNNVFAVSDQSGCLYVDSFSLWQPDTMITTVTPHSTVCSATTGSVLLTTTGGVPSYDVYFGALYNYYDTVTITGALGSYDVFVSDSLGCQEQVLFTISAGSMLNGTIATVNPKCNGSHDGQTVITMSNGVLPFSVNGVTFDTSVIQFDSLAAGSTNYIVTDSFGCSTTFAASLSQPTSLLIDSNLLQGGITCFGRTDAVLNVTAIGGTPSYIYNLVNLTTSNSISQSGNIFNSLGAGSYVVSVIDSNGCLDSLDVNIPPFVPSRDSIVVDSVQCYDANSGVIKIYPLPADRSTYTFSLNGGAPQVYNVFYNLSANNYQVIVADANNCKDTLDISIGQPDSIDGRVWLNDSLLPRDSIILTNRSYANFTKMNANPWTVVFSPPVPYIVNTNTWVQIQPQVSETYTITIFMDSFDKACFVQYTGYIDVLDLPELPNTITPNGDGVNDTWKIDLIKYPDAVVTIFDRWGEVVYTSTDYNNEWAGIDQRNGKKLPDGTYFYILKVPSQNNAVYKGDINIVDAPR